MSRSVCTSIVLMVALAIPWADGSSQIVGAEAASAAEPAPGQAGWLFDPGKVVVIDLTLSPAAEAELEAEPDEYVKGGFSLYTTDGTPSGEEKLVAPALTEVGIRLKGGASFRPLSAKAAFKIKFKEFSGPKFEGLKKLTLNNMVEDPSMIHETLAYEAFRAAGVPASRSGYAYVLVNGEDFGLYLNVETLDDVGLERWFGKFDDPQHLYEGEYGADVLPGQAGAFEVDEGDEADLKDLEALIAAVNSAAGPSWSSQVAPVVDLQEMTRMWGVEKYVGHWDGYAGWEKGANQPNNYYLYSSQTGVFQMLPWGTDETWDLRLPFDGPAGLMFDECLADPACAALYRKELRALAPAIASLDLDSLAESTADLLRPWEQLDPQSEHSAQATEDGVKATREFIADRPDELDAWLGPEAGEAKPLDASSSAQAPSTASAPSQPPSSLLRLHISLVPRDGGILRSRMHLPEAGQVGQRVTIATADGVVRVCAARARAKRAGAVTLRCRLSPAARKRLRARWLTMRVTIRFESQNGSSETVSGKVVIPRLRRG